MKFKDITSSRVFIISGGVSELLVELAAIFIWTVQSEFEKLWNSNKKVNNN
jgi:hypothetical protein